MENATKALLIAAAVLIVIVIIALGVRLLNAGDDVTGQADTIGTSTSMQSFNAQFSAYEKDTIKGSNVRTLYTLVKTSNSKNPSHVIKMTFGTTTVLGGESDSSLTNLDSNNVYSCEFGYDGDGYLAEITIK